MIVHILEFTEFSQLYRKKCHYKITTHDISDLKVEAKRLFNQFVVDKKFDEYWNEKLINMVETTTLEFPIVEENPWDPN